MPSPISCRARPCRLSAKFPCSSSRRCPMCSPASCLPVSSASPIRQRREACPIPRNADPMSHDLFEAARTAMVFSHSPYSKFPVGAAIRADDGKIYAGANIENLSFPQGWCAEPTAISLMIMGGGKKIVEMAVIAEKLALCPPCGGCRQKIAEFAGKDKKIYLCDHVGGQKPVTMTELLPFS